MYASYLKIIILFTIILSFSACEKENTNSKIFIEDSTNQEVMDKKAITFPVLPTNNIDIQNIENN